MSEREWQHGDWVSCKIRKTEIKDARIVKNSHGLYICQNMRDGANLDKRLGYKYAWFIGKKYYEFQDGVHNLKLIRPMIEVGDILVREGDRSKVLGVMGDLIGRSYENDHRSVYEWALYERFQEKGWHIESPEPEVKEDSKDDQKHDTPKTLEDLRGALEAAYKSKFSWEERDEYAEASTDTCALCDFFGMNYTDCNGCSCGPSVGMVYGCMGRGHKFADEAGLKWKRDGKFHRDSMVAGLNQVIGEILEAIKQHGQED